MSSTVENPPAPMNVEVCRQLSPEALNRLPRLLPRKKKASPPQKSLPLPETPPLPSPLEPVSIISKDPSRRILSHRDLEIFLASPTYSLLLSFVFSISESAADKTTHDATLATLHPTISKILDILDLVEKIVYQHPAKDQGGSRFGNPAFRDFLDSIVEKSHVWHRRLIPEFEFCINEVSTYLHHAFGNRTRIDYGSGHELNFITWLLCLNRLSILPEATFSALALVVLPRYIKLLRSIQKMYYLEPAGSHGVWGLDDYHFLPFLVGASQLLHHPYIRPLSIHNEILVEEEADEYLYLDMVRFTMASKTVKGLKWTQPMLDDISGAKTWEKIEQGMRRIFVKEVLGKLPVMQHFLFGGLVPAVEGMSEESEVGIAPESEESEGGELRLEGNEMRHAHRNDEWGDCCGIKIPSIVAAAQATRTNGNTDGLRRVPFD